MKRILGLMNQKYQGFLIQPRTKINKNTFSINQFSFHSAAMQKNSPFTPETIDMVNKTMGGLELIKGKKIITTSIVLTPSENNLDDLRIIKKVPGCPNPSEDYFLFMFLRAYSKSLLNTVQKPI